MMPYIFILIFYVTLLAGWVTNVIWTFQQTDWVNIALGIVGAFLFPIGAIHGIWVWF